MPSFRTRFIFLQLLSTLLVLLALCGTALAEYQARHGLTPAEYQATFTSLASQGYRLKSVGGYVDNGAERYAALWLKASGVPWVGKHGLSPAEYQTAFDQYARQGYRLIWVSAHEVNGQLHYEGIWEQRGGPEYQARHGLTAAQYQQTFDDLTRRGYRLLHVSGYAIGGQPTFAAIFEKSAGPARVAKHSMTAHEYQQAFDTLTRQGYRLVDISGYAIGGTDYYAAIWEQASGPYWWARNGVPTSWYQNVFDNFAYQGYAPALITAFSSGNGGKINGVWDNTNWSGADLDLIKSKMSAYMTQNGVPGAALAITKDGKLVYAGGFGLADTSSGVEVGPTSMFRIASVSKNITTAGIMKLIEAHRLSLTDKVFGPGSLLGQEFPTPAGNKKIEEITVKHLLEHVSGLSNGPVDANGYQPDPMFQNLQMNHHDLISWYLNNPIYKMNRNPNVMFEYLNMGFCLLGRIIEHVTHQPYDAWIKANVLGPAGVTEMAIAGNTPAAALPREVSYYPANVAYSNNVTRFDSHGGWVASPIDLVRYVLRVDGLPGPADIISADSHTAMLTDSHVPDNQGRDPNYGFGWGLPQWHNGDIYGTIAFLEVLPGGYTYAVVCNTRPTNDQGAFALSGVVKSIIAGVGHWPAYNLF